MRGVIHATYSAHGRSNRTVHDAWIAKPSRSGGDEVTTGVPDGIAATYTPSISCRIISEIAAAGRDSESGQRGEPPHGAQRPQRPNSKTLAVVSVQASTTITRAIVLTPVCTSSTSASEGGEHLGEPENRPEHATAARADERLHATGRPSVGSAVRSDGAAAAALPAAIGA
jgi:hypothetical protein